MSPELAAATDRHPKYRGRLSLTHELCRACGVLNGVRVVAPRVATLDELLEYHERSYLSALAHWQKLDAAQLSRFGLEDDCAPFPGVLEYCTRVAGASLAAADQLVHGYSRVSLSWSGGLHHGQRASAAGFCFVNDAVLAIMRLQRRFRRILYVDVDLHHGDAVQSAFEATTSVLTLSLHKFSPGFFPNTGAAEELGVGRARFHQVNVPLRDGLRDEALWPVMQELLMHARSSFDPDCVVLQSGADGLAHDPFASWNLTHKSYEALARAIHALRLPTLVLGGGGYNKIDTARCFARTTAVFAECRMPLEVPEHKYFDYYAPSFTTATAAPRESSEDLNTPAYLKTLMATVATRFELLFRSKSHVPRPQAQHEEQGGEGTTGHTTEEDAGIKEASPPASHASLVSGAAGTGLPDTPISGDPCAASSSGNATASDSNEHATAATAAQPRRAVVRASRKRQHAADRMQGQGQEQAGGDEEAEAKRARDLSEFDMFP